MHLALGSTQLDLTRRAAVLGLIDPGLGLDGSVQRAVELRDAGADAVWLRRPSGTSVTALVADLVASLGTPVGADAADVDEVVALADAGALLVGLACDRPDALVAAEARGLTAYLDCAPGTGACLPVSRVVVEAHLDDATALHGCTVTGAGPATWGRVLVALAAGAHVVRTVDVHAVRRVAAVAARLLDARSVASREDRS